MLVRILSHRIPACVRKNSGQKQANRHFTNDVDMLGQTLQLGSRPRVRVPTVSPRPRL